MAALEIPGGERAVRGDARLSGDRVRQLDQRARELSVDRLRALRGRATRDVEHERPVDGAVGDRAEADEVGEDRQERAVLLQAVELTPSLVSVITAPGPTHRYHCAAADDNTGSPQRI